MPKRLHHSESIATATFAIEKPQRPLEARPAKATTFICQCDVIISSSNNLTSSAAVPLKLDQKQLFLTLCSYLLTMCSLINLLAVGAYGEAEFWLSGGKVILICLLFMFTFITMVGGNPQGDAYGFRYWSNPGAFNAVHHMGALGHFEGFLTALWNAAFTVVGPEYISMVAAEAMRPRTYIKTAFKTVYWRFGIFFIVGALCAGIVIPYNDPELVGVINGGNGGGTAAASPYVIAMGNLGIDVLPDIVNALLITSIFSAGNTYTYAATRTLYGLSLEGRAPRVLQYTTKKGVPFFCFLCTIAFAFLSFLSLSKNADQVLQILVALITAGGLIDYVIISWTFIAFYNACKAQGVDRRTFPYYGRFQPYCGYIGLVGELFVVFFFGYESFYTGDTPIVQRFFQNYALLILAPILFIFWKVVWRTKFVKKEELDLVWERPIVDQYEASFLTPPTGFWTEMGQLIGIKRKHKDGDKARRRSSVVPMGQAVREDEWRPTEPEKL